MVMKLTSNQMQKKTSTPRNWVIQKNRGSMTLLEEFLRKMTEKSSRMKKMRSWSFKHKLTREFPNTSPITPSSFSLHVWISPSAPSISTKPWWSATFQNKSSRSSSLSISILCSQSAYFSWSKGYAWAQNNGALSQWDLTRWRTRMKTLCSPFWKGRFQSFLMWRLRDLCRGGFSMIARVSAWS